MLKQLIDATKYETRTTKTGEHVEPVPPDAAFIEGWPIDPPDDRPGWFLVDWHLWPGPGDKKDSKPEYHMLWARLRGKVKKAKRRAKAPEPAVVAPKPAAKTPRQRKPRNKKSKGETPPSSENPEQKSEPAADPNTN